MLCRGKALSALDKYDLNMKIEVLKERGSQLLARLYKFEDSNGIKFNDSSNPWILISNDLSYVINPRIYISKNFEDINNYIGYFDGIERLLESVNSNKNN